MSRNRFLFLKQIPEELFFGGFLMSPFQGFARCELFQVIGLYPMLMMSPFQGFFDIAFNYHWATPNAFDFALSGLLPSNAISLLFHLNKIICRVYIGHSLAEIYS